MQTELLDLIYLWAFDDLICLVRFVLYSHKTYSIPYASIIIEETNGVTTTSELTSTAQDIVEVASYYSDEYTMRLTKQPAGDVQIIVESTEVASDIDIVNTNANRDFSKRKQVYVNGVEVYSVTFTSTNWYQSQSIQVMAIDDSIEEGKLTSTSSI